MQVVGPSAVADVAKVLGIARRFGHRFVLAKGFEYPTYSTVVEI